MPYLWNKAIEQFIVFAQVGLPEKAIWLPTLMGAFASLDHKLSLFLPCIPYLILVFWR